ncbi:MAG: rod shape-determining protein RodA [Pseudomonadota bacterium]
MKPIKTKQEYNIYNLGNRILTSYRFIDITLLCLLTIICIFGLFILYSASNQNLHMVEQQSVRFILGIMIMFALAQVPPDKLRTWAIWLFILAVFSLLVVLVLGHIGKGAKRWLNLGFFRLQPSELMLVALPMVLAWYFENKILPPKAIYLILASIMILIPAALIAKQPDLGTAVLLVVTGSSVILLAGLRWRVVMSLVGLFIASAPLIWHYMRNYQKARVLTFLNPESDPLGRGYHIIQSKIAIGSGGLLGKGWLHGTQSHLQFLPEHATDFIFSVCSEEFGFIGCLLLILLYFLIILRAFYIAYHAQNTFTRLLAGSLGLMFFFSFFINIGMVTGLLPVVGLPLPLISYGGSSIVTFFASFGIIMSIHTHRKLVSH